MKYFCIHLITLCACVQHTSCVCRKEYANELQPSNQSSFSSLGLTKSQPKIAQSNTERLSSTEPAGFVFLSTVSRTPMS